MFLIVTFSFVLFIAIFSCIRKLTDKKFNYKLKRQINKSLNGIIISGIIGLGGLILVHLCFTYILYFPSGILILGMILAAIGIVATIYYWIVCPGKSFANRENIDGKLSKLNFIANNEKTFFIFQGK